MKKNTMKDNKQELTKGDVSKANKLQKEFERTNSYSDEIKIIDINIGNKTISDKNDTIQKYLLIFLGEK